MKGIRTAIFLLLMVFLCYAQVQGMEPVWDLELSAGSALNIPMPLTIRQEGYPDLTIPRAAYATRPLTRVPYYAVRLMRWQADKGWGLELVHHKLYLLTEHPVIDEFEITHGFNLINVNRGWQQESFRFYLGLGPVLAHPQTTIRGQTLYWWRRGDPFNLHSFLAEFYLCGVSTQVAAGYRWVLSENICLQLEGKVTGAYAHVPIKGGYAVVRNIALHGLIGLSRSF